jgi:hypothetical protein
MPGKARKPAKSQAQQQAAGIALEAKKTGAPLKPGTPSAQMAQGMDLADLQKMASTKRKGLPQHVKTKRG